MKGISIMIGARTFKEIHNELFASLMVLALNIHYKITAKTMQPITHPLIIALKKLCYYVMIMVGVLIKVFCFRKPTNV